MRADPASGRLSTYGFPEELRVDELLVRAPRDDDVERLAPAFRDPAVGGEAGMPPFDVKTLRLVMREQLPQMRAVGLIAPYVIEDARSGEMVGGAALHHLDPMRDTVEIGYWLFVEARGRGIATRVVHALVEHAFRNGICRVEAHVRLGNEASERVLARAGFEREGVKRRYLRHGDERVDATLFALIADDA